MMPRLCVVVPVYNEQESVALFFEELRAALDRLDLDWSVLFVDDGSWDGTSGALRRLNERDRRVSAVSLSRNFGKEIAIAAGLRFASGDLAIVMDGDLQHPPEAIGDFVAAWRRGARVVFGQRIDQGQEGHLRRMYSWLFYKLFRAISTIRLAPGAVDFVLLDRRAIDAMNSLGERTRFAKGLFRWIGFPSETVVFTCGERVAGVSKWKFRQLSSFALDGVVAFSSFPLKIWSYMGAVISGCSLAYAIYFLIKTVIVGVDVPGFPSLLISSMFFAGVQLMSLGVIGEYLSRIFEEVKGRPLFLVGDTIGLPGESATPGGRTERADAP